MGVEIRLPNITGTTEREQLLQLKSYLYQLSEQLQWAFDTIDTSGKSGAAYVVSEAPRVLASSGPSNSDAQATFSSIKSLIIKSADIVDAYYEEINKRLEGVYVAQSDFGAYAEQTALEIEATSKSITQNYENVQVLIQSSIVNTDQNAKDYAETAEAEAKGYTDSAKSELDDKIGETANELDGKIVDANGRIDETNSALGNLGDGLDAVNGRMGGVESELASTKANLNDNIQRVADSVSTVGGLLESAKAQLRDSLDQLEFDLKGISEFFLGVSAYIKSGALYSTNSGIDVYGIEIGQEVNANGTLVYKKFARFTSEKLSFYDANDNEVAYVSDKKLYIGQAEVTISLKIGGFVDAAMPNGDVVTKWEGVSG